MRHVLSVLLVMGACAGSAALGACGGDDNKSSDNASTTNTTTGGTTSTGEQTTTTGKKGEPGRNRGTGKKGSSTSGGGGGSTATNKTQTTTPSSPSTTTPSQIPKPFDTAKKVCGAFLPRPITRAVDNGKRSAKSVARQYSRAWPEDQKADAYKGCLAGLKARKAKPKK